LQGYKHQFATEVANQGESRCIRKGTLATQPVSHFCSVNKSFWGHRENGFLIADKDKILNKAHPEIKKSITTPSPPASLLQLLPLKK
jgi:hypothetical protein